MYCHDTAKFVPVKPSILKNKVVTEVVVDTVDTVSLRCDDGTILCVQAVNTGSVPSIVISQVY